jgi:hypothetical protein
MLPHPVQIMIQLELGLFRRGSPTPRLIGDYSGIFLTTRNLVLMSPTLHLLPPPLTFRRETYFNPKYPTKPHNQR